MKPIPMPCVVPGCKYAGRTEEDWINHFQEAHPEIDRIRIGQKRIQLKQGEKKDGSRTS